MSATTTAVILTNPLPAQLIALSVELVAKRDELAGLARAVVITDVASLANAESLFVQVDGFTKDVKEGRLILTRQLDALKEQLMDTEKQATAPLLTLRQEVARKVLAFREEYRRKVEEEAKKQREEAEAAARKQREEQELVRKEQQAVADEAERVRQEEAALFGEVTTPAPAPVAPAPLPVVPIARVALVSMVSALPRSAVRATTRTRCVIDDPAKIIAEACKTGGSLFGRPVLTLDEKAVAELMKAGCAVPGARQESYEVAGSNGARS